MSSYTIPAARRQWFDYEEYVEAGLIVPGGISIIVGPRDIGKTVGTIIKILHKCSATEMVFFGRNTMKEIEAYAKSFNAQYATKFKMTMTQIWRLEPEVWINKKTKEEQTKYKPVEVIGFVGALNGVDGWRSANFDNVKYVYFDEFNQIGNSLDVQKFLTLWTSIMRARKDVITIIVGNRDDAAADLLIELSVDINIPPDHQGDWVYQIASDDPDFADKMFFIDLDDSRFIANDQKTAWKVLGNMSAVMGDYYNRGYKTYENADCYKLKPNEMAQVVWDWAYDFDTNRIVCGQFKDTLIIHLDLHKSIAAPIYYADYDRINKGNNYIKPKFQQLYFQVTRAMRNEAIVYTSIAAKEWINIIVDQWLNEIDDNHFKL